MALSGEQPHRQGEPAAPAAVAPPPGNPRFPLLDGMRAIAALLVVALHSAVYTSDFHGFEGAYVRQFAAGVTVFFLLSGFLLYRPFVHARVTGRGPIAFRAYARRRLLRIVPAYWLALTVLAVWPGLPGFPLGESWWRFYLFLQDFHAKTLFEGLGTAWSLGTEVSFYLVLPVYALVVATLTRGRTRRAAATFDLGLLLFLSLLSLLARASLEHRAPNLGYTLLGTFDWFAAGMAVAVLSVFVADSESPPRLVALVRRRPSVCWFGALVALTAAAGYWVRTGRYDPYSAGPLHLLWEAFALCLLLPAVFAGGRGLPRRVLGSPFVAWLGLVSYGIYLWHLPLIPRLGHVAATITGRPLSGDQETIVLGLLVATCAVACAAASYYVVERPLLAFKGGFTLRRRADADGSIAVPEAGV